MERSSGEVAKEMARILEQKGICADDLDELVHDAADAAASQTNNAGMEEQLRFVLSTGWKPSEILKRLELPPLAELDRGR